MTHAQTPRPRVLVTGARRGIGRGIAWAFAENGHDVVINDLVEDGLVSETLAGIRDRGAKGAFLQVDIAEVGRHDDRVVREAGRERARSLEALRVQEILADPRAFGPELLELALQPYTLRVKILHL